MTFDIFSNTYLASKLQSCKIIYTISYGVYISIYFTRIAINIVSVVATHDHGQFAVFPITKIQTGGLKVYRL